VVAGKLQHSLNLAQRNSSLRSSVFPDDGKQTFDSL
jgi:hypothetical protein